MSSVDKATEEGKMQGVGCGDAVGCAPSVAELEQHCRTIFLMSLNADPRNRWENDFYKRELSAAQAELAKAKRDRAHEKWLAHWKKHVRRGRARPESKAERQRNSRLLRRLNLWEDRYLEAYAKWRTSGANNVHEPRG